MGGKSTPLSLFMKRGRCNQPSCIANQKGRQNAIIFLKRHMHNTHFFEAVVILSEQLVTQAEGGLQSLPLRCLADLEGGELTVKHRR